MTTFTAEDIAFQRAILAAPDDTTLKLVYADWLQDRADPRAWLVREQARGDQLSTERPPGLSAAWFGEPAAGLDPRWVAFMTTLAQPFFPIRFQDGEPGHPFTEPVGERGQVVTFGSNYRNGAEWNEGLLADLAFLTGIEWGGCAYGAASEVMSGFLCDRPANRGPLTARDALAAVKAADFQSEHIATLDATDIPWPGYHPLTVNDEIHSEFDEQKMFYREGSPDNGSHGRLRRHVLDGHLWYLLLHIGGRPCEMVTLLAVGRSPHGNRLVGAITSRMCHNLCD